MEIGRGRNMRKEGHGHNFPAIIEAAMEVSELVNDYDQSLALAVE